VRVMKKSWYVLHTYSNQENKVKASLERTIEATNMQDKIFSIVVPTREEVRTRQGGKRTVKRKVFPGYVFVEMILNNDSWYLVRQTYGVTGFVGMGARPEALDKDGIDKVLGIMEGKPLVAGLGWEEGINVQVLSGPFANFIGKVAEVRPDQRKLRVLLSLFDRETPVELEFDQVEKI